MTVATTNQRISENQDPKGSFQHYFSVMLANLVDYRRNQSKWRKSISVHSISVH